MVKSFVIWRENAQTHDANSNIRGGSLSAATIDVRGLAQELRKEVDGEIRFDDGARALYATDGSHYRQVPIGVVIPRDSDAVVRAVGEGRK